MHRYNVKVGLRVVTVKNLHDAKSIGLEEEPHHYVRRSNEKGIVEERTALEAIKRIFQIKSIYTRRIAHLFFFLVILVSYFIIKNQESLLILSIFLVIFCISYKFKLLSSIHIKEYLTYGEIIYILCFILLFLFWGKNPYVFISSSFVLGFVDPISALIKKNTKKYLKYNLLYLILCFLILSLIAFYFKELYFPKILIASFLASIADRYSHHGLDNITTPMVIALFLS